MMTCKYGRIGAAVYRGVVGTTLLVTALALRADDDITKSKTLDSSVSTRQSAGSADTTTCVKEAAKMNTATIKFAQLAAQKSDNAELKRFGQMLEQDHQKAQADLEKIAQKHNVVLSTTLDQKCQDEMSRLQGLSGQEFDREFAKGAVEGHAMAVAHLQQAATEAKDPELRQYTQNQLAQIKEHQRLAREIAQAVGVDQATITSLENKAKDAVGAGATSETSSDKSRTTKEPYRPKQ